MPSQEVAFVKLLEEASQHWNDAANEIQQEPMRAQRDAALCNVAKEVTTWQGTVDYVGTYITNEGSLNVAVTPHITLRTEGDLQNLGTKIARDTPLFDALKNVHKGQKISFSGRFVKDDSLAGGGVGHRICLEETSLTDGGSMRDPSFIFMFTAISPVSE